MNARKTSRMSDIDRRSLLGGVAAAALLPTLASSMAPGAAFAQNQQPAPRVAPQPAFSYDDVIRRAREIGAAPYDGAVAPLPEQLSRLDWDLWMQIRFRPDRSLLGASGGRFRLQLFHLGHLFTKPVTINTVRDGIPTPVPYTASLFDYGSVRFDKPLPVNMGFAGFRIHFPSTIRAARTSFCPLSAPAISAGSGATRSTDFPRAVSRSTRAFSTTRRSSRSSASSGSTRLRPARIRSRSTRCSIRRPSPAPTSSSSIPATNRPAMWR